MYFFKKILPILVFSLFLLTCSDMLADEAVYGCMDQIACNYDKNANIDLGCIYPEGICDCDGSFSTDYCDCDGSIDSDDDAVCDNVDICIGLHTTINDNVYICSDLQVLQDFIDENESLNNLSAENIGVSQWNEGFLTNLSLAEMQLTSVPQSIGTLDSLETLFLNDNQISLLPEDICNLPIDCQIQV